MPEYGKREKLPVHRAQSRVAPLTHIKVLFAIARCRTAALGGHIDECTHCGHRATISYNSCRNRHCPKCQTGAPRPSLTPGIYFRSLLIGYFEGIDSERGIAWRLADSLALRRFVGIALDEYTPDHSTISRTRRLMDLDTHREVFTWVLGVLADRGLLQGKRIAIDATTLEANAAMRSIRAARHGREL